jgi:uncharacterized protein (TIGR00730 family)
MTPEEEKNLQAILHASSYVLAEQDTRLLAQRELRPVRLQLELLKPEMGLAAHNVESTIVIYGSTRIVDGETARQRLASARAALAADPKNAGFTLAVSQAERLAAKSRYYDEAREFTRLVSSRCQVAGRREYVVVTGGGPGIMEAANRGAFDIGAKSIGLNISLPAEQMPNPYITPDLCFQFHYFAIRKMHFLLRAAALVAFPGGYGTLDEFFDAITLRQTRRMQEIPIILYGRQYWDQVMDLDFLLAEGMIDPAHRELVAYADTPEEAWQIITQFHDQEPRL